MAEPTLVCWRRVHRLAPSEGQKENKIKRDDGMKWKYGIQAKRPSGKE